MDAQNRQPQHFPIKSSRAGVIVDYMPMLNQDISLDVLDQQQSKEQAKLLQRFKQLKEWQKEQQDKLIRQQQEQLHVLRNEQQRVQSILSAQRHKQWGGGVSVLSPGKQKSGVFKINSSGVTSTSSLSTDLMAPSTNHSSSTDIPLGHALPPHVMQTLLQTVPPTRDNPQIDLDSTGEAPHSDTEDGFYPLPETSSEISHQDAEELQMLGERRIDKEDGVEDNQEEIIDNHFDNNIQNNDESHCKENNDKEDNNISNISNDFDNQPVTGKGKRFEELLEQQLSLEAEQEIQKPPTIETKPKRSFLKRGQGISRFGMKTFKLKKKEINGKVDEKRTKEMNGKVNESSKLQTRNDGKLKKTNKSKPNEQQTTQISRKVAVKPLTPTNRLVLKPEPKPATKSAITKSTIVTSPVGVMTKPIQSHVQQEFAGQGSLSKSDLDDTIEVSFQNKVLDWQVRMEEEKDDLDEFELLEQAADDNASFSSNASLVLKVMQRAALKNQVKDPKDVRDGRDPSAAIDGLSNKIAQHSNQNGKKVSEEHKLIERKRQSTTEDFEMMEQGLRDEDKKDERRKGGSPTEEDESDTLEEDEIDDNSDAIDYSPKMKRISTLHSRQMMAVERNEEEDEGEIDGNDDTPQKMTSSHQLDIDFDDDESWGEFAADESSSGDESITAGDPVIGTNMAVNENELLDDRCFIQHSQPIVHVETNGQIASSTVPQRQSSDFSTEESSPPMAELASKLFPTLKKQPTEEQVHHQAQLRQAHAIPLGQGVQSKLLRDKLCELETEIERFRTENSALAKLRAEREKDLELLKNEIATFEKQKNEELKRLEEFKAEETKKLKKERRNFEKYQQAMKSMPDKKGREEIERLKDEISELQEELNNKERRWTASSSRLHKRIEVLNDENNKLRDDIKQFEEKRLENLQKDSSKKKVKKKKSTSQLSYQALPEVYVPSTQALPEVNVPSTQAPSAHPRQEEGDFDIDSQYKNQHDIKSLKINTSVYDKSPKKQKDKDKSPEKSPETDHQPRPSAWGWPHSQENNTLKGNSNEEISKESGKLSEEDETDNSIQHPDGKVEHVNKDGSRVILFKNGTRKDISSNGETITVTFFNGDIKQILPDQRVVYYYQETQTTHTTYQDGLEILQFANNQMEKHYPDGTKEITFPDQTIKYLFPNGREESIFGDGTVLRMEQNGDKVMEFANGQREVHTAQYKKREYPDGTVKTVYPDGRQETRYSTGRIRVKDKDGTVIVDQKT